MVLTLIHSGIVSSSLSWSFSVVTIGSVVSEWKYILKGTTACQSRTCHVKIWTMARGEPTSSQVHERQAIKI